MATEYFPNNAITVTTSDPGTSGTSVTVSALPDSVTPGNAKQFRAIIYDPTSPASTYEIVLVTNVAGSGNLTWTITRAIEGPSAQAHGIGQVIKAIVTNAGLLNLPATILSTNTPAAIGTAAAGSGTLASKDDHVHNISDSTITSRMLSTTSGTSTVLTDEGTTSSSYTDLATSGPAVTLSPGITMKHLIIFDCFGYTVTATNNARSSVAIGGNVASDNDSQLIRISGQVPSCKHIYATSQASGNTHTMKYRSESDTGHWVNRRLSAFAIGQ